MPAFDEDAYELHLATFRSDLHPRGLHGEWIEKHTLHLPKMRPSPGSDRPFRKGDVVRDKWDGSLWEVHGTSRYAGSGQSRVRGLSVRPAEGGRARVIREDRFEHVLPDAGMSPAVDAPENTRRDIVPPAERDYVPGQRIVSPLSGRTGTVVGVETDQFGINHPRVDWDPPRPDREVQYQPRPKWPPLPKPEEAGRRERLMKKLLNR